MHNDLQESIRNDLKCVKKALLSKVITIDCGRMRIPVKPEDELTSEIDKLLTQDECTSSSSSLCFKGVDENIAKM